MSARCETCGGFINPDADHFCDPSDAKEYGAERERAAIVAWLRENGWEGFAGEIEDGEHLKAVKP